MQKNKSMHEEIETNSHAFYGSTQSFKNVHNEQPPVKIEEEKKIHFSNAGVSFFHPKDIQNKNDNHIHDPDLRLYYHTMRKRPVIRYASICLCIVTLSLLLSFQSGGYNFRSYSSIFNLRYSSTAIYFDTDIKYGMSENSELTNLDPIEDENESKRKIILPREQIALLRDHEEASPPFSTLSPVNDLKVLPFDRSKFSTPGVVFGNTLHKGQRETGYPLPTNKWYENMILLSDEQIAPNGDNVVYTVPYVISANGPIAGIKLGSTRLLGLDRVVQVTFVDQHGLTLGAAESFEESDDNSFGNTVQKRYAVYDDEIGDIDVQNSPLTPLGFTIKWEPESNDSNFNLMTASVVRGMPYGTIQYKYKVYNGTFNTIFPTVVSQIKLYSPPIADSNRELACSQGRNSTQNEEHYVKKSIHVTFLESDITWIIFYSHPVYVKCFDMSRDETSTPFVLQATRFANASIDENTNSLISRVALMNNCTRGTNPSHCKNLQPNDKSNYGKLLHKHADVYPGSNTKLDYTFFSEQVADGGTYAYLQYDWDAHHVRKGKYTPTNGMVDSGLLMYSLPHHRESMYSQSISRNNYTFDNGETFCTPSLNGQACIVDGAAWVLKEDLEGEPSFFAPRPPNASSLQKLSKAISEDINFRLPQYYARGAGDTYFSGKMLAKLSRILLVTHELKQICRKSKTFGVDYVEACQNITLPNWQQFKAALDHLRLGTQVWINGTAETPFVYDDKWGGMCSCGCYFNSETQSCDNAYPDCPAFSDPGLDFGHAFYNDHHFHQGYHIYAAATVAYFDHDWGTQYFENVLLLVRDIANPSTLDQYFPQFRMKDWYLGNSWAGGIARAYPNGRNQESSSESIAAYEAISMYGEVMSKIFSKGRDIDSEGKAYISRHMRDVGRLLTATELRSADRYWHVRQYGEKSGIYPPQYKPFVVGIMWNMMAQFQTWFGNAPHLAYGIQLIPLTPVSERRDAHDWVKQLYPSFAESCSNAPDCTTQGWGILQHAVLAELGQPELAIKYAEALPEDAFESAGGNGHSLTNTIWYYATRPETKPINLKNLPGSKPKQSPSSSPPSPQTKFDCGCPDTCTVKVQNYSAGGFTCGARISWLMSQIGKSERDACSQVAGIEYTDVCAGCDPNRCTAPLVTPTEENELCPPCSRAQCINGHLNRCPVLDAPFLCTDGANKGGCSMVPWKLDTTGGANCNKCCQLTYQCK